MRRQKDAVIEAAEAIAERIDLVVVELGDVVGELRLLLQQEEMERESNGRR